MPHIRHQAALAAVVCVLASCQQTDQQLPFELDGGGQTISIGPSGGVISIPPNFFMEIPPGALASAVSVAAQQRVTAFPDDAGELVPISAYDVGPAGTTLLAPARVQMVVPPELLQNGEELSLAIALLMGGNEVVTQVTSYDLINGFLTADIMQLGPVAAVVASDVIPIGDLDELPDLVGGSFAPPAPVAPVGALAPPPPPPGTVQFYASCSSAEQACYSSGIVEIYVDDVVRERLGENIVLYDANVEGLFEFSSFLLGRPTVAYGYLTLEGELRTRLNTVVAGRRFGEEIELFTGGGGSPSSTVVAFSGNTMVLTETSVDSPAEIEYSVAGVGTGEQLTLQFEGEIEFSNPGSEPSDYGHVVVQVRLRR